MKKLAFVALIAVSACSELPLTGVFGNDTVARQVNVLGRNWTVWQDPTDPRLIKAERENNNINPYGPPAVPRTTQALRAMETATGCTIVRSSLYQNDMGQFYGQGNCPTTVTAAPGT